MRIKIFKIRKRTITNPKIFPRMYMWLKLGNQTSPRITRVQGNQRINPIIRKEKTMSSVSIATRNDTTSTSTIFSREMYTNKIISIMQVRVLQ